MSDLLQIICGDAFRELRKLPTESAHCCVTSPPYWGLRDYGTGAWEGGDSTCDHIEVQPQNRNGRETPGGRGGTFPTCERAFKIDCGKCGARRIDSQLGLEKTPDEYVAKMVEVFREVRRVLRRDGTLWLNLGDSYAANGVSGLDIQSETSTIGKANPRSHQRKFVPDGLKPKDLCGIPVLEIRRQKRLRAVGADRGIAEDAFVNQSYKWQGNIDDYVANGRNKRSVWTVATAPYPEAHFATYPPDLIKPCIMAGTSAKGCCAKCGAPWERIVERTLYTPPIAADGERFVDASRKDKNRKLNGSDYNKQVSSKTLGWQSTCKCCSWHEPKDQVYCVNHPEGFFAYKTEPCTVLDPFAGSGTTGAVALELGRKAVLIELNPAYIALIHERCTLTPGLALA